MGPLMGPDRLDVDVYRAGPSGQVEGGAGWGRPSAAENGELVLEHVVADAEGRERQAVGLMLRLVPPGPQTDLEASARSCGRPGRPQP